MDDRIFSLGDEMARTMPTPQEHAIEAEAGDDVRATSNAAGGLVDRHGRAFDPTVHRTDDAGNPILTSSGLLRVRRGGSPSYVSAGGAKGSADAIVAGQTIADTFIGCAHMALGDEWAPRLDPATGMNERLAMGQAWGRYLESRDMRDIPPGVMVTMVMTMYALPRLVQPQTQSKLARFGNWSKEKLSPLLARFRRRGRNVVPVSNAAQ
jgi:hypothetical protein